MKFTDHVLNCVASGCLAIMLAIAPTSRGLADAPRSPRVADVEILSDQGWSTDPDVIWYDNFDGQDSLSSRYIESSSRFAPVDSESLGGTGRSLRAHFDKGQVGAGGIKKTFGRNPMDYRGLGVQKDKDFTEIYWRHYVKHEDGWTGNPAKLSRAIAFSNSDWSQAMIAHVWGGGSNRLGFDPVRGVNASSQVTTQGYNDFDNFSWLGFQNGTTRIFDTAESGRWVSVEGHVKLNTPGKSDGVFDLFIDGRAEISRSDLNWVYSWDDYAINAVFLENFWNSGSPVQQERFFDDFVISTSYIGLAKSPRNPFVTKTVFHDRDVDDSQSAWRLQIATGNDGSDLVWDSDSIVGDGLRTTVNSAHGTFLGSLDGQSQLLPDQLYSLRVQQRDMAGNWSDWSDWSTSLQTGLATVPEPSSGLFGMFGMIALGMPQIRKYLRQHYTGCKTNERGGSK